MAPCGKCQCIPPRSLGGGLGLGGPSRISPAAAPRQGGGVHYTCKPHASAWHPCTQGEAVCGAAVGRGVVGREEGGSERGWGGGRGRRRCCPGGGGRREGAAAAAAAASPAATQTPGAAEAVSRSACPRLLRSQSGVGVAAGAGVRGAGAPGAAWGNPAPAARRAQGWARGARGAGDLSLQPLPDSVHSVNSPVLPPMSLREKKTKPKTLRTGGRSGGSNFAEGRAEVRGAGKMGAHWVGRGRWRAWRLRDLRSIPPRRGVGSRTPAGSPACGVGPERPQEACARGGGLGRGLWERLKGAG